MHSPDCRAPENIRLLFLHKSGEPPEHPDHQIAYDHDVIGACPSCAGATLERLRHDCFDRRDGPRLIPRRGDARGSREGHQGNGRLSGR